MITKTPIELDPIQRLTKDLKQAATTLSVDEARYLVDSYYQIQENRKGSANQVRSLEKNGEPSSVLAWYAGQSENLENQIKRALDAWSSKQELGVWARGITGIGPVIAAGLLANIDLEKAPTVGHIWRFAGLDPTSKWAKGTKRPWNASLKTLCWKIGESFVKVQNHDDDVYGKIFVKRKEYEWAMNLSGALAGKAADAITVKRFGADTSAIKWYGGKFAADDVRACLDTGDMTTLKESDNGIAMLPPAHIHSRAKRYAVKLFLAHYHEVGRKSLGLPVAFPYPIAILGHAHMIAPPN